MLEPVSVLSVATAGFKLALTLYSLADAIGSVDTEIKRVAIEISLFSDVLQHLAEILQRGQDGGLIADKAIDTVQTVMSECRSIFHELEMMIEKSAKSEEVIKMKDDVVLIEPKLRVHFKGRFLYFFQKSKVETLRRQLESLKTTLNVWIGMVSIAKRIEEARTRKPEAQTENEMAKSLNEQDNLKMKCLVLANEAAAAEVRKHTKLKGKNTKEQMKSTNISEPRPSIASEGVLRELSNQPPPTSAPQFPVPETKSKVPTSNEVVWSMASSTDAVAAANKDPGESKIGVEETDSVVLALSALWVSKGARPGPDGPPRRISVKTEASPKRESTSYASAKSQDLEDEVIDLFPRRAPRPY